MSVGTRLYPPADPEKARGVGIPRAGEVFDSEDAKRLVGAGLASRQDPKRRAAPAPKTSRAAARDTREG